jgi:hypothetical protein
MKTIFKTLILASSVALIACAKNTECKANITCHDQNGQPIANAKVFLYAEVKKNVEGDVKAEGITDANGKVSFIFKLPAIFDVKANVNSKEGKSIIKLEEGKTVEETVIVQ